MEKNSDLNIFLNNVFFYLTNTVAKENGLSLFRRHNNKLDINGDISFPLNINAWKKYIEISEQYNTILEYKKNESNSLSDLVSESENWKISISKCEITNDKVCLFLNRKISFENTIKCILLQRQNYASSNILQEKNINLCLEYEKNDFSTIDLTQLRLKLLLDVTNNFLKICGANITRNSNSDCIYLTNKSKSDIDKKIVCGVVISTKFGKKNTDISAQDYYSKRTIDMRLMAQHKYGVRVNSEPGWRDFFEKLGNAAVTFDLLHVKPNRTITINVENATSANSKGASFILYNYARLSTIFKHFEKKISSGLYPKLPELNEIDFSLLNQPEEWEILFVYLMQYPQIVESCVKDIDDYKLNVHNLCTFIDSLCSLFSIYYRRIRILTEPRSHLFPILYARIYFLQAIQEVFHNALTLLNIPPVQQM